MKPGQYFALILVVMWGLTVWMAYNDGKAYWTYMGIMALTVLAGLASGTLARVCVDVLRGVW